MPAFEQFPSLTAMFFSRAREKGEKPFLWAKHEDVWRSTSWAEAARKVASLAAGLKSLGIAPGDRVMLVSENRPEFCIADLAIMAAGAITVPTYTTNTTRDHEHIIANSGARAVIFSTAKIAKALMPAVVRSRAGITHDHVHHFLDLFGAAYEAEVHAFVACVRDGTTPRVTGEDGRWATLLAEAAQRSLDTGQPVDVEG